METIKRDMITEARGKHMDEIQLCGNAQSWEDCFTKDLLYGVPHMFFWYNVSIKGLPKGTLTTRIIKRRI